MRLLPLIFSMRWLTATTLALLIVVAVACAEPGASPPVTATSTSQTPLVSPIASSQPKEVTATSTNTVVPPTATVVSSATRLPDATSTTESTPIATALQPTALPTALPTETAIPTQTPGLPEDAPLLVIGDAVFVVELADTSVKRVKGLGERDSLDPQTGMLFVFESGRAGAFWMKGMRFPLDFVWIGDECTVVDIAENVPHADPSVPDRDLPIFESRKAAVYTFEINAGEIAANRVKVDDEVRFLNIDSKGADC